jgi:hypothetical protein
MCVPNTVWKEGQNAATLWADFAKEIINVTRDVGGLKKTI